MAIGRTFWWARHQKYIIYAQQIPNLMLVNNHIPTITRAETMHKAGQNNASNPDLMKYVKHHKFNVDWLIDFDIPEDGCIEQCSSKGCLIVFYNQK